MAEGPSAVVAERLRYGRSGGRTNAQPRVAFAYRPPSQRGANLTIFPAGATSRITIRRTMAKLPATDWIWRDGEFIRWNDAQVHVLAHSMQFGSSLFEGVRCYATPRGPAV